MYFVFVFGYVFVFVFVFVKCNAISILVYIYLLLRKRSKLIYTGRLSSWKLCLCPCICLCVCLCLCLCHLQMKPGDVLFPTMYDMLNLTLESWKYWCSCVGWYPVSGIWYLVFGIWHLVFWYFSLDRLCQALSGCRTLQSSVKLGLKSAGEPCQRHRPRRQSLDAPTPTRQLTELNSSSIFHLYEAIDCIFDQPQKA